MPSNITHPAVALGLAPWFWRAGIEPRHVLIGACCCVLPDVDALGHALGLPYESFLGHRGFTHSLTFALGVAALATWIVGRRSDDVHFAWPLFAYLALCCASHGFLDAFTNGGRGVAFFSPLDLTRYFFPWRPIVVSPLSIGRFLSGRAGPILLSELKWVVLPSLLIGLAGLAALRVGRDKP